MKFEGIDYVLAAKYIALNMEQHQITRKNLQGIVPRRIATSGSRPTVLTCGDDEKKERWKFFRDPEEYTEKEKKKLMGKVTEILVKTTFQYHCYKWDDSVRKQSKGGSIGVRGTGSVAKATMDWWIGEYRRILTGANVEVLLLKKYVDDVCIISKNLDWGARWDNRTKQVTYHSTDIIADLDEKRYKEEVTMRVLRDAASSIADFLEFTSEVSRGPESPHPVLDTQLWMDASERGKEPWYCHSTEGQVVPGTGAVSGVQKVMYKFYSKPVTNRISILQRSAMPEGLKVATTAQEVLRRLKTTSEDAPKEMVEDFIRRYMDNLTGMGYPLQWRTKVLKSTMIGYMKILQRVEDGEVKRNRMGKDTVLRNRFKKLVGDQYWYRVKEKENDSDDELSGNSRMKWTPGHREGNGNGKQQYIESVVFVPHTPHSELKGRLNRVEQSLGFKTKFKYVERLVRTLGQQLIKKDPVTVDCGRQG